MARRISDQTAMVLDLFASSPETPRYGREVIIAIGLKSGSLYPILHRLESSGLLTSYWEDLDEAVEAGRRPRRMYRFGDRPDDAERLLADWRRARRATPSVRRESVPAT